MADLAVILAFWGMVLAPCFVALHTGAHTLTEDV